MKRISDELFITEHFDLDNIIAIRIENGEFYFLGWMENAEHYSIQMMSNYHSAKLDRDLVLGDSLYNAITTSEGYDQHVFYAWIMDDHGKLVQKGDLEYDSPYARFLSFIRNYERNGISDQNDHDIFCISKEEFRQVMDALRDGDYVFVIDGGLR